jgi:hypothetical protein
MCGDGAFIKPSHSDTCHDIHSKRMMAAEATKRKELTSYFNKKKYTKRRFCTDIHSINTLMQITQPRGCVHQKSKKKTEAGEKNIHRPDIPNWCSLLVNGTCTNERKNENQFESNLAS